MVDSAADFLILVALGTFGASTKHKLTRELSPLVCSLGGAEHIRTMHVEKQKRARQQSRSLLWWWISLRPGLMLNMYVAVIYNYRGPAVYQ